MSLDTGEKFTQHLQSTLKNRVTDTVFDLRGETEALLRSVGASLAETGGALSFYGQDPIVPSMVRFGAMSAVSLAAKAAQIASIWKMRTGRSQDIHVDVRKALRRFSPFIDQRWELVNGYDGGMHSDPQNPLVANMFETKDGKWVLPTNPYPQIHLRTAALLGVPSMTALVARAIKGWNGEDLEQAGVEAGIVMPLARPLQQIMHERAD